MMVMKRNLFIFLFGMVHIMVFGQDFDQSSVFEYFMKQNFQYPKDFFDIEKCEIEDNYNTIFNRNWSSLHDEFGKRMSSSGIFTWKYLYFENDNIFKIINGVHDPFRKENNKEIIHTGIYKFDNVNKLLYMKYSTGTELVCEIKYYKYNGKSWDNWEYVLELFLYRNAKLDTPFDEIIKLEKIFYERYVIQANGT